jgi:hypothetical protein
MAVQVREAARGARNCTGVKEAGAQGRKDGLGGRVELRCGCSMVICLVRRVETDEEESVGSRTGTRSPDAGRWAPVS